MPTVTPVDYSTQIAYGVDHAVGFINAHQDGFKTLTPYGLGLMVVVFALFWLVNMGRRFIGSAN